MHRHGWQRAAALAAAPLWIIAGATACVPSGAVPEDGRDGFVRPGDDGGTATRSDSGDRPNGADSGGGVVPPPPPPATGAEAVAIWCDALAEPICANVFACCDAATRDEVGGTEAACVTNVTAACPSDFMPGLAGLFDAGTTGFDAGALPACAAALFANATTCDLNLFFVLYTECIMDVWPGQTPAGFMCASPPDLEIVVCAGGVCEDGVCSAFLPEGAPCNPGDGALACDLSAGRICRPGMGGGFQCLPFLPQGAACQEDFECETLTCGPAGTCGPVVDVCEEL